MRTQKQRIFSLLVLLTMVIVLTCIFVACDKGGAQDKNYTVTIHPDNGQADFVWDTKTDIPVITKYGYHIGGFYLDEDMTISTTLESLKATNLTADLNVYVKWEKDSVPPKTKIVTKNLLCDYDTRALSGKVSNSTTVFSFYDEISVEKGTTYTISTDINGINVIPSKTVNLEIGDNIFYVLVSNEDELTLYTATVRRKPIYTVTFDTLGGTEVEAQQVEEDAFATAPTTEKNGCTFEKWDWDFSMPITENTTITAIWNAFVYNIVYDFNIPEDSVSQEVDNSMNPTTYTVDDTIYFAAPKRNGYYLTRWSISRIVKGTTGTITTTAQWSPIAYEIIYDFNDENSVSKAANNDFNPRYYSVESEINFVEPTRAGYSFVSWDKNIEKGTTGTQTVTASWNVIDYDIVYNFGDASSISKVINNELNPATYTIEDEIVFSKPTRAGYEFLGWDKTIVKGMTNEQTISASWSIIDYDISYNLGDADSVSKATNNDSNPTTYTVEDDIIFETPTRPYYEFVEWSKNISKGSVGNQNIVAVWKAETHTITYVLNGWTNAENNKTTYTIEDQKFALFDGISGESLFCGWYLDVEYTNCIETIDASLMKDYIVYAMPDCGTTKGLLIENGVVKGYLGISTNVVIPSYYKGDTVVCIGYYAFYNCSELTSITIPNTVTSIGNYAFDDCTRLKNIYYIGNIAKWCEISGLGNLMSSSRELYIDNNKIEGDLTIPNGVTCIGNYAFAGCSGLTSVTIPDSVTSIRSYAFDGCTRFTNIYYTGNISGWCGISGLDHLMSSSKELYIDGNKIEGDLIIPNGVTRIGNYAFAGCGDLTSLTIPDSVVSIGYYAFSHCGRLTNVVIPDSVTSVDFAAFSYCRSLTSLEIGKGVRSIGEKAFIGCSGLTSIIVDEENTTYYSYKNCLIKTSSKALILGCQTSDICGNVKSIGDYAFYNCSGLTSITIPFSVTSIGAYAFGGCSGLTSIVFSGRKDQWKAMIKETNWNYGVATNCTLTCSDGTI